MAGEERKIIGYTPLGNPVYELASSYVSTREEKEEMLLRNLDLVLAFENGKEYFDYADGEFFEMDENGNADISHTVTLDKKGNIVSSKPFDIMAE